MAVSKQTWECLSSEWILKHVTWWKAAETSHYWKLLRRSPTSQRSVGIKLHWKQLRQSRCELLTWQWQTAQKFTLATMQYLAPSQPISTICPEAVSLFFFLWLAADLPPSRSISMQIDTFFPSSTHHPTTPPEHLQFYLTTKTNQPFKNESHSNPQRNDVPVFTVGCNQRDNVWEEIKHTKVQCSCQHQNLCACIHSQTCESDQTEELFIISLMIPPAGVMKLWLEKDIGGLCEKYHLLVTLCISVHTGELTV